MAKKKPTNIGASVKQRLFKIANEGQTEFHRILQRYGLERLLYRISKENKYHCHIKSGNPTYVVCWEIIDSKVKIMEVYYAGTHEKAPY